MELESYLVRSVAGIVSVAKDKHFRDKAMLQAQVLAREIGNHFSVSEQQQILSVLLGNMGSEVCPPRIVKQCQVILDHLSSTVLTNKLLCAHLHPLQEVEDGREH